MQRASPSVVAFLFLMACAAGRPAADRPLASVAALEAAFAGDRRLDVVAATAADAVEPTVLALDPIVAQLLRAAFAAHAVQRRVILENLANVNTAGYKKRVVVLGTQCLEGADGERYQVPVVSAITPVLTTGALEITERSLDVGLDGDGWFAVLLPDGSTGYTRAGVFQIDAEGRLVTAHGHVLLPQITVPADLLGLSLDPEGRVTGVTAGNPDASMLLGQLTLHRFVNPAALLPIGDGVLRVTEASGQPMAGTPGQGGLGLLKQGFVERSNVQATNELVALQILERQHQTLTAVMRQFGMIAP